MVAGTRAKKKKERLEARVAPETKSLLERAAELRGCTLTDFIVASAQAAAEETIREHQILALSARDTEALFAALENPPVLDEKMRDAARRHRATVQVVW